jgi:uncharacterized protein YaeQ
MVWFLHEAHEEIYEGREARFNFFVILFRPLCFRVELSREYRGTQAIAYHETMALTSTIYNFNISLSDMDRSVYESFALRVAQHPTETPEYMLTRVLAYCLEYCDGIALAKGLEDGNEPAVWARDPTGALTLWVEVGMPDADKLHRASKAAPRLAIYTHRDPDMLRRNLAGKTIHRAESIPLFAFDRSFIAQLIAVLDRRMSLDVSVTEGHVYINAANATLETQLHEQSIVG